MADDLQDIGDHVFFSRQPYWSRDVSTEFAFARYLIQLPGTVSIQRSITPEVPIALEMEFQNNSKQEEYELIDHFSTHRGRWKKFWFGNPASDFVLSRGVEASDSALWCQRNDFEVVYQGYERIYLYLTSGDWISRKITAVTSGTDGSEEYTYLSLSAAVGRAIALTECARIGRLLLGRFANDVLSLKYHSINISTVDIGFVELPNEYPV